MGAHINTKQMSTIAHKTYEKEHKNSKDTAKQQTNVGAGNLKTKSCR